MLYRLITNRSNRLFNAVHQFVNHQKKKKQKTSPPFLHNFEFLLWDTETNARSFRVVQPKQLYLPSGELIAFEIFFFISELCTSLSLKWCSVNPFGVQFKPLSKWSSIFTDPKGIQRNLFLIDAIHKIRFVH